MCDFYQSLLVGVVTSRYMYTVVLTFAICYMLEMKYSGVCVCVCVYVCVCVCVCVTYVVCVIQVLPRTC